MFEKIFVTVGTTSFQSLIDLVVSDKAADQFSKWGVKKVLIQGGKSSVNKKDNTWTQSDVEFQCYDYKTSIRDDMRWGDLIICHAGAGTTIEALDMGKVLMVVPNETLMDNHQIQLAEKLHKENYAFMSTVSTFFNEMKLVDPSKIKPFPPANAELLMEHLNTYFKNDN